jgi:hypothetical protein
MSATIRPRTFLATAEGMMALFDAPRAAPTALQSWPGFGDWLAISAQLQVRGYGQDRALQIAGRALLRHRRRHQHRQQANGGAL